MRRAVLAVVLAALVSGCSEQDAPTGRATVEPPADGGGFADCAPQHAVQMAVPFSARSVDDALGRPAGVHRLEPSRFLWVWGSFEDSLREDRVTRVNEVQVFRADARLHVCTRVEVAAPTEVDDRPRTFDVAVLLEATSGLPEGDVRVVVNWVAGCPCEPLPRGNDTATFAADAPTHVSQTA